MTAVERKVLVAARHGLHARPAAMLVKAAAAQTVAVTIRKPGGKPAPARSMLSVLALGVEFGDEVILAAEGDGAETAVDALVALLLTDPDADPAQTAAG